VLCRCMLLLVQYAFTRWEPRPTITSGRSFVKGGLNRPRCQSGELHTTRRAPLGYNSGTYATSSTSSTSSAPSTPSPTEGLAARAHGDQVVGLGHRHRVRERQRRGRKQISRVRWLVTYPSTRTRTRTRSMSSSSLCHCHRITPVPARTG
jgi:hypothetical protein